MLSKAHSNYTNKQINDSYLRKVDKKQIFSKSCQITDSELFSLNYKKNFDPARAVLIKSQVLECKHTTILFHFQLI